MKNSFKDSRNGRKPSKHYISKAGYNYVFESNSWRLDGSIVIKFDWLLAIEDNVALGFKKALSRYAEELSAMHCFGLSNAFKTFMRFVGTGIITLEGISNFRNSLLEDQEYKLGKLKSFLIAWHDWGFKGIDASVVKYLEELTLKGIIKGKAVKGACPYSGPLTHNELGSVLDWASNAFSSKHISLKQYSFFLTLAFTGRRSVQLRSLRYKDLIVREDSNGNDYVINCPRAKLPTAKFREYFTALPINEDLYLVLHNQRLKAIKEVETLLSQEIPVSLKEEVPIFIHESRIKGLSSLDDLKRTLLDTPDFLHMNLDQSMRLVRDISKKNMAYSERTGDIIHFSSRRMRYTKATNLSRRGISGVALAFALDQSDTQHIGVYAENTEETAKQIDEVMAQILAPLAQAFSGKLIASERDAARKNDPNSRVKNSNSENVGNCGTYVFCASGFRACYTCSNFEPWLEAPHEEALNEILAERQRQEEIGVSDNVIQSTDRLLLAVQQVILMCKQKTSKELV